MGIEYNQNTKCGLTFFVGIKIFGDITICNFEIQPEKVMKITFLFSVPYDCIIAHSHITGFGMETFFFLWFESGHQTVDGVAGALDQ